MAILEDGSIMYVIQALGSATQYGVGVLLIVMADGHYAIMDGLARNYGGSGLGQPSAKAWPHAPSPC